MLRVVDRLCADSNVSPPGRSSSLKNHGRAARAVYNVAPGAKIALAFCQKGIKRQLGRTARRNGCR